MWLATKQAARRRKRSKPPSDDIILNELGGEYEGDRRNLLTYKRLMEDFPGIERGPDEAISDHYSRLKRSLEGWRSSAPEDEADAIARGREVFERAKARSSPEGALPITPDGVADSSSSLPTRDPGWYVSPETSSRGFGVPPMSRRDPGASMRDPVSPVAGPTQQSMGDWVSWLADKGIYLTPDGRRMTPDDMALPRRPLRGQQIWGPFTRPAKVVVGSHNYPGYHPKMINDGWAFHGDGGYFADEAGNLHPNHGSGSRYQMDIGDKTHVIVRDENGWVHNSGPVGEEEYGDPVMTGKPMFFDHLGDAVLHVKRGTQVGLSTRRGPDTVPDSSYHPERTERSYPMVTPSIPMGPKGKFQTLNSTWSDEV